MQPQPCPYLVSQHTTTLRPTPSLARPSAISLAVTFFTHTAIRISAKPAADQRAFGFISVGESGSSSAASAPLSLLPIAAETDSPQAVVNLSRTYSIGAWYRLLGIASCIEQASTPLMAKTVLIADDSASMRLSVRMLLEGRHTELMVCEAVDGIDAIRKAKTSQPDLILLDLAMPRLNGAEAAYVLKNDMPETPVVLFTMTDLNIGPMCAAIDVDFISKADGVPKLLERVDALFWPN